MLAEGRGACNRGAPLNVVFRAQPEQMQRAAQRYLESIREVVDGVVETENAARVRPGWCASRPST